MRIRTSFSRRQYLLLTSAGYIILVVLVLLEYVSRGALLIAVVASVLNAAKLSTYSVAFDKTGITVIGYRFFIERTISRPIDNISLEIIYSGSTGKPKDAILNVFEGTKCIYQVYAYHGFTEDQFKELMIAFDNLKVAEVSG